MIHKPPYCRTIAKLFVRDSNRWLQIQVKKRLGIIHMYINELSRKLDTTSADLTGVCTVIKNRGWADHNEAIPVLSGFTLQDYRS